uniref:CRAL-TRIO domain-containing protein n=1 Tax=Ditylenchus dipsaci TaxID=166011 RepID=A0A915EFT9_9BILA
MEQQALRHDLRKRLGNYLPSELDSDFTLDRWLENYNNRLDECVDKFREYLINRKVLGYDQPESLDQFYSRQDVIDFHNMFSLSKLDSHWVNDLDNGIVFVETGVAEPSKVVKALRVAEYANIFFGYCEYFQKMVMEQEKKSGKRSFGICIFDMKLMNFIEYINPMAAINRMFQARVNIWMEYYGELLKHLLSVLLPTRLLGRFTFAHKQPEDIESIISRKAIPSAYGGQKVFDDANILDNGCYLQKQITKNEYLAEGLVWHKLSSVCYEDHVIKVGSSYCREMDAKKSKSGAIGLLPDWETVCAIGRWKIISAGVLKKVSYLFAKMRKWTERDFGAAPIDEESNLARRYCNQSRAAER